MLNSFGLLDLDLGSAMIVLQKDTKGQYLIDYVCQSMDLIERDYFGLRYVNQDKQRVSVDVIY